MKSSSINTNQHLPPPAMAVAFFGPDILDESKIRAWMFGQFHTTAACPRCKTSPSATATATFWGGGRVSCKACGLWYTATTGTPLAGLKLSITQIFLILVGFGLGLDIKTIAEIVGTTPATVRDFRRKLKNE
jgi:transposase-like protein